MSCMAVRAGGLRDAARAGRRRYTEWDEGRQDIELYDHDKDPGEHRKLANDPAYFKTIGELKRLLRAAQKAPVSGSN